jgi:hypothetical protein
MSEDKNWIKELEQQAQAEGLAVADRPTGEALALPEISLQLDPVTMASMVGDQLRDEPIFVRQDSKVVELRQDGTVVEMTPARFVTWAGRRCFFFKPTKDGEPIRRGMTQDAAKVILESEELQSRLRPLRRLVPVRIPIMDPDGTVRLADPGYDKASGIVVRDTLKYEDDWSVERASDWIRELVKDFPWGDDGRSLAVWVCSAMTVFCQAMVKGLPPMFVFVANRPGSGKTVLAKMGASAVFGRAGVLPWERDSSKLSEQLNSMAVTNAPFMILDNVKGYVSSEVLEGFLTSAVWTFRRFHSQSMLEYEKNTIVYLSGNDATVSDDLIRRSLFVDLFADQDADERASGRNTEEIDDAYLSQSKVRSQFLSSMWAIVKNWAEAGKPKAPTSMPSFQSWADVVAGMVVAAGFQNPLERAMLDSGGDRSRYEFKELLEAALREYPDKAAEGSIELTLAEWCALARGIGVYREVLGTVEQAHAYMVERRLFRWDQNEDITTQAEMRQAAQWMDKKQSTTFGTILRKQRAQKVKIKGEHWQFGNRRTASARLNVLIRLENKESADHPF